jgi:hypothetical protein
VRAAQIRHGEHILQEADVGGQKLGGRLIDDEGQGDGPVGEADLEGHLVVIRQPVELGEVIVAEQRRLGESGGVIARVGQGAP